MRTFSAQKASLIMAYYVYFALLKKRGTLQGINPAPPSELMKMSVKALTNAVNVLKNRLKLF